MDMHEQFGTDESFEQDGIWYQFDGDKLDKEGNVIKKGTKFLLARAGGSNVSFGKRLEALTRPYRRQIENETIDPEFANGLLREAWCATILKGWEGFVYKGEEIPYSVDNAAKYMELLPDLYMELRTESQRLANFRAISIEDDAGN